jgi:hypothetical protein
MSTSRRRLASVFSLLALSASTVLCVAPVRAAQPFEDRDRICASAAEMSALSLALGAYFGKVDAPGASVSVRRTGDDLRVRNAALGIDVTVSSADNPELNLCSVPADERLATVGAIPLSYAASFSEAVRYRASHPPDGGYGISKKTSASMFGYGPYVIIALYTPVLPPETLGCLGEETYRVDPRTGGVLPFDGCVEGHKRVLPGLQQLPPA